MDALLELISNNALISSLVGTAIIALVAWSWKARHDRNDSEKIRMFLIRSKSETGFQFRSTEAIASNTMLPESRVALLCSRHKNFRRNEKEKQSWALVE